MDMSLDKAIKFGKEKRKPYYNSGAFDMSCRPGGDCQHCSEGRQHKHKKKMMSSHPDGIGRFKHLRRVENES